MLKSPLKVPNKGFSSRATVSFTRPDSPSSDSEGDSESSHASYYGRESYSESNDSDAASHRESDASNRSSGYYGSVEEDEVDDDDNRSECSFTEELGPLLDDMDIDVEPTFTPAYSSLSSSPVSSLSSNSSPSSLSLPSAVASPDEFSLPPSSYRI